ncbi:unnamed protein product [Amoebophrya sp. A25]|nr:unnamed protein product [Amoebophrya sp. A25]|eukprot:GSA25T00002463001.1
MGTSVDGAQPRPRRGSEMTDFGDTSPTRRISASVKPGGSGRPLQICEIDFEDNCVKCCHENLEVIAENLKILNETVQQRQALAASKAAPGTTASPPVELKVAVVAVMGMYRTGKSFLLDLLLRYLRNQDKGPLTRFDPKKSWRMAEQTYENESYCWLGSESRISEGAQGDNERGFQWRSGVEKCTKGIWLWSHPFLVTEDDDPLAVLVMDTQGAWDSQMSSEQSSCIFGITSMLSSKLIYNLQNRISEEKIDNLDYFTTYAGIVIQEAREKAQSTKVAREQRGNLSDDDEEEEAGMGDIHFLVRDWEYFEDGWSLDQCTKQVSDHLMTHLDPNRVAVEERRETITRLHNLFRSVNLCCLPHPGPRIPKSNWKGTISDIDSDFLYLLTHFFANLSHGEYPLKVAAPLGQELTASSFTRVVETLVSAFHNARPDATSLRKAFVTCETHRAKEDALAAFNAAIGSTGKTEIQDPETMEALLAQQRSRQLSAFKIRIRSLFTGSSKEEDAWREELMAEVSHVLEEKSKWIADRNRTAYTQATWKLVATPTLVLPITLSVLSLPHLLLYGAVGVGGAAHLNARAGHEGVRGWFAPDVLERVFEDCKNFAEQRWTDVVQMMYVARRCDKLPSQISDSLTGGSAQAVAAGVAAQGAAAAAAVQTAAAKHQS